MNIIIEESIYSRAEKTFQKATQAHGFTFHQVPILAEETVIEIQQSTGAKVFVLGTKKYSESFYRKLQKGTLIYRFGVGVTSVPLDLCQELELPVGYTPGTLDNAVAEHSIALMLDAARKVSLCDREFHEQTWSKRAGRELRGKTLLLLGFGPIAKQTALIARLGLGMKVIASGRSSLAPTQWETYVDNYTNDWQSQLSSADVVSLHLPGDKQTNGLVNQSFLVQMKPDAILVNTARGSVINESDLYDHLQSNPDFTAALDVFIKEPYEPQSGKDLRSLENAILVPHCGSNTTEANTRMAQMFINDALAFAKGDLDMVHLFTRN